MKIRILLMFFAIALVSSIAGAGTIAHYMFQEKAVGNSAAVDAVIVDATGSHDGVVKGAALDYVEGSVPGDVGLAFTADGGTAKDRVEIPASDDFTFMAGVDSFTIEVILNIGTDSDYYGLVNQDSGGTGAEFWWRVRPGGVLQWYIKDEAGAAANFITSGSIADGQWHHIAAVYDGASKTILQYIDGVVQNEVSASGLTTTIGSATNPVFIGEFLSSGGRDLAGDIAEVRISDAALTPADFRTLRAASPTPLPDAVNVLVGDDLSWSAAPNPAAAGVNPAVTGHYVYLSTDPNTASMPKLNETALPVGTTTIDPGSLDKDSTYYWRVDERLGSDTEVIAGDVWMFDTELSLPTIDMQPLNDYVAVDQGEAASFTVVATDPLELGLDYQWYEGAAPDTTKPVGDNLATLVIADVETSDLGREFYCVVSNTKGSEASDSAMIVEADLVSHWTLDGVDGEPNGLDISGNDYNGDAVGTTLVEGIIGDALQFGGTSNYVELTGHVGAFSEVGAGTITAWVKVGSAGGAQVILAASDDTQGSREFRFFFENNDLRIGCRGGSVGGTLQGVGGLKDNEWHFVAAVHDDTDTTSMYVDGRFVTSATTGWFDDFGSGQLNFMAIGVNKDSGGVQWGFPGVIDDVRVYGYPMGAQDVADLYVEVEGSMCLEYPMYDLNEDCRVDLYDFAILAQSWLECNLVPTCK